MMINELKTAVKAISTEFPLEMAFELDDEYFEGEEVSWNTLERFFNQ